MAEQLGLSARLKMDTADALLSMKATTVAFKNLQRSAAFAQAGVRDLSGAFSGIKTASIALSAVGGATIKRFVDFESQFGAVKAVLGKDAAGSFDALEAKAKQLGATTSFTAKQAAEAMENLARAGFKPTQILGAITPVLSAAAAEGMNLGAAADIVASNMRAFGLGTEDAAAIAGKLALVSARTNTTMLGLQEGLKFVAPSARALNIPLSDTAATLGLLANVGIKGSLAGTALKNSLIKLSAGAKRGQIAVGKQRIEISKTADGGVDLKNTFTDIVKTLGEIESVTDRQNAAMKLFGLRGAGVATAFDAIKSEDADKLFKQIADETGGAATEMARMRLDNFAGDFVRLGSAIDGAAIAIGKALAPAIRPIILSISQFSGTINDSNSALGQFSIGVKEGIAGARDIFGGLFDAAKGVADMLGLGGGSLRTFVRTGIKLGAVLVSVKLLTGGFSRLGLAVRGSFRLIRAGAAGIQAGLGGAAGFLSKFSPGLFKRLPGGLRKLGGAIKGIDSISANPVRVVNFNEAPGGTGIPGGGSGVTPPKIPGAKLGAKGLLKMAGGVVAAGAIGFGIGTLLDKTFGFSDKISDFAAGVTSTRQRRSAAVVTDIATQKRQLSQLASFQKTGGVQLKAGGPKQAVTRELALSRIRKNLESGTGAQGNKRTNEEIAQIIKALKPALDKLPAAVQAGIEKAKVTVAAGAVHKGTKVQQAEADSRTGTGKAGQVRDAGSGR